MMMHGAVGPMFVARVIGLAATLLPSVAHAQLTPLREYLGINRPAPMKVALPAGVTGEASIALFEFGEAEPKATAAVAPGSVNLASLFPSLWSEQKPKVLYAQLVVGDVRTGPPVVLQPMINPPVVMLYSAEAQRAYYVDPSTKRPSFDARQGEILLTPDVPVYSGLRAYVEKYVALETTMGVISLRMRPDQAPNTVRNFLDLVEKGFYTDIIFHRVVPRLKTGAPFVIQVGDPTGTGSGGPGYSIDYEPSLLAHDFGVISMARDADPNTNGSQVFICLSREGTARLDGKYTSFGEAVSGAEVIANIGQVAVKEDRPVDPPVLKSARLMEAPPFGTGPAPVKRPKEPEKAPAPR